MIKYAHQPTECIHYSVPEADSQGVLGSQTLPVFILLVSPISPVSSVWKDEQ